MKAIIYVAALSVAASLTACLRLPDQVNLDRRPRSNEQAKSSNSQESGYMRIMGDLRWDKLTSLDEWAVRFPECASRVPDEYIKYETERIKKNKERYSSDTEYQESLGKLWKTSLGGDSAAVFVRNKHSQIRSTHSNPVFSSPRG